LKKILIACEFSGTIRDEFIKKGYDAYSCDLRDGEGLQQNIHKHIKGDVLPILDREKWDLLIAHPPCTFLANSSAGWLYNKDKTKNTARWSNLKLGAEFFKKFLDADCPHICVENPIPLKYAVDIIGRKYDQKIQPYQFGHKRK